MRKAHFYITKLLDRGWDDDFIAKFCNIKPPRFKQLKKIGTIPTVLEVRRLRSMLRLPTKEALKSANEVWAARTPVVIEPEVESHVVAVEEEPVLETPGRMFRHLEGLTDKQWGVLKKLEREFAPTRLDRREAITASSLRRFGLVTDTVYKTNKGRLREWALTDLGTEACSLREMELSVQQETGSESSADTSSASPARDSSPSGEPPPQVH